MNTRIPMLCLWSGIVFILSLGIGWFLIAQFIPPHSPSLGADEIASIYQNTTTRIRWGMLILISGGMFYLPWAAVIAQQIERIESGGFVILSRLQMMSGALTLYMFVLPEVIWATAAFRPERPEELTLLFNDFGWIMFVGMFCPFWFSPVSIAVATFMDKRAKPIFPRWVGYLNLWVAVSMPLGVILMLGFRDGPFAWNGIIVFWIPAIIAGIWFIPMFVAVKNAVLRQAHEFDNK